MSMLHYQVWTQTCDDQGAADGRLVTKLASGTIPLTTSPSAAVTLPSVPPTPIGVYNLALVLKVVGTDRAYVEARSDGQATSQTGAHASTDALPRTLVGAEDGAICERVPSGTFTAVLAAAIS